MNEKAQETDRFASNIATLLPMLVVGGIVLLMVDWGNVWRVLEPLLDFLLR